jgi:CBS domain-containing protein
VVGVGASAGWVKVEAVMTPDPAMVDEGAPLLTALHLLQVRLKDRV